jgi:hypothetical protein
MKSQHKLEGLSKERLTFHTGEDQPGVERSGDSGVHNVSGTLLPGALAPLQCHTSQTERSVIHPDRRDLEWYYCRGAWIG